ncbi:MAG: hypothetical protein QOE36_2293 [Gaiellaceae bacterium]|nr:hypothetical protein [Gaiellaceae bacterium]
MVNAPPTGPPSGRYRPEMANATPLLVYDGDCAFCTTLAEGIAARWRAPARAVAWQRLSNVELARLGLGLDDVRAAAWWVDDAGRLSRGHLAIAHALVAASGWRALWGRALLVPPLRWLGAAAYPLVARARFRLPGGTPACRS